MCNKRGPCCGRAKVNGGADPNHRCRCAICNDCEIVVGRLVARERVRICPPVGNGLLVQFAHYPMWRELDERQSLLSRGTHGSSNGLILGALLWTPIGRGDRWISVLPSLALLGGQGVADGAPRCTGRVFRDDADGSDVVRARYVRRCGRRTRLGGRACRRGISGIATRENQCRTDCYGNHDDQNNRAQYPLQAIATIGRSRRLLRSPGRRTVRRTHRGACRWRTPLTRRRRSHARPSESRRPIRPPPQFEGPPSRLLPTALPNSLRKNSGGSPRQTLRRPSTARAIAAEKFVNVLVNSKTRMPLLPLIRHICRNLRDHSIEPLPVRIDRRRRIGRRIL